MAKKNIYVLHEYGAPTHYLALESLAERNGCQVVYHELNNLSRIKQSLFRFSIRDFIHAIGNIFFLLTIQIKRSSKIVLGIAPYNKRLKSLMRKMRHHEVYYHTSYSCWDESRYVYQPKSKEVLMDWKYFTNEYVKHIFAVSQKTKNELIKNGYADSNKISVVNHSYSSLITVEENIRKSLNFIYVGVLSERKGIEQLLEFFSAHVNLNLTIIGKGNLEKLVKSFAEKKSNINYIGYIIDFSVLVSYYKKNSFLVLNSKRIYPWEELFGMVIIEAMACGCVPITTDHPGPQEIITNGVDGLFNSEENFFEGIRYVENMTDEEYLQMRKLAIQKGKSYYKDNMASRWNPIFN